MSPKKNRTESEDNTIGDNVSLREVLSFFCVILELPWVGEDSYQFEGSFILYMPIWHVDIWTNQFLQKYRFLPSSWHSVIRRWRIDLENIWRFYFFKSSILLQAAFMNSIEEGSFQMLKTKCKNFVITGCRRGFHWILSKHRFRIWNFFHSFKMTLFLIILIEECYFTTLVYRIEAL